MIIIIMYLICVSELTEQPGVKNSYFCPKKVTAVRRYSVYIYLQQECITVSLV